MTRLAIAADDLVASSVVPFASYDYTTPATFEVGFTIPTTVPTEARRSWRVECWSQAIDSPTFAMVDTAVTIDAVFLDDLPPDGSPTTAVLTGLAPDLGTGVVTVTLSFPAPDDPNFSQLLWGPDYAGRTDWGSLSLGALDLRVWYVLTTDRPVLRQRQSPRYAPSRVRTTDLRQRQTPYL